MAGSLSTSPSNNENLDTYSLIWADSNVHSSRETRHFQHQAKLLINHFLTFEEEKQCLQYIKNLSPDDRIILIVSGRYGRQLVPQLVNSPQIVSIYIFCLDKKANDQWSRPYPKVKGVLVRLDELIKQIEKDYNQQQDIKLYEPLSIKIYDDKLISTDNNQEFLYSQLLIDCLIRMNCLSNDKQEFISYCKQYYHTNNSLSMIIRDFENNYSSDEAVLWFTKYSFLSRLLNKPLKNENIHLLYLCKFIFHDIAYQLGQNRCTTTVHGYRSQLLTKDEFECLKNSTGKFLATNSFLSASTNIEKIRSSLHSTDIPNQMERVLFQIEANPKLHNIKPFGFIQSSNPLSKTKDILFMVGSIFRIEDITCDNNDNIWIIRLSLCSLNDPQLKYIFQQTKQRLGNGPTTLLQFAQILFQMDKLADSEKYYRRYLNQLPPNHPDLLHCYYGLGKIFELKKSFQLSLKWYKRILQIIDQQKHELTNANLANLYNTIADAYFKTKDYKNSIKFYEKSLEIWSNDSKANSSYIVKCLNNMGAVYDMMKEYTRSLECYQKAVDLAKTTKDPDLAMTYRNLANAYEFQDELKKAKKYYEKSLKIYSESSCQNQFYIKDIKTSLERVASKIK